jgi:hypothetical protein
MATFILFHCSLKWDHCVNEQADTPWSDRTRLCAPHYNIAQTIMTYAEHHVVVLNTLLQRDGTRLGQRDQGHESDRAPRFYKHPLFTKFGPCTGKMKTEESNTGQHGNNALLSDWSSFPFVSLVVLVLPGWSDPPDQGRLKPLPCGLLERSYQQQHTVTEISWPSSVAARDLTRLRDIYESTV